VNLPSHFLYCDLDDLLRLQSGPEVCHRNSNGQLCISPPQDMEVPKWSGMFKWFHRNGRPALTPAQRCAPGGGGPGVIKESMGSYRLLVSQRPSLLSARDEAFLHAEPYQPPALYLCFPPLKSSVKKNTALSVNGIGTVGEVLSVSQEKR